VLSGRGYNWGGMLIPHVKAAAVTVGCALALAACGSSAKPGGTSGLSQSAGIRFSACMRAHGLPSFPDPQPGGGIQIAAGSGINPASPAFQDAQKRCRDLVPGGGPGGGGGLSESRKLALLHLSQCMRRHGFTSFPDPTSTPPSAPPDGGGLAFGGPGGFIAVPGSMLRSPGFQQAAGACGFPQPGAPAKKAG